MFPLCDFIHFLKPYRLMTKPILLLFTFVSISFAVYGKPETVIRQSEQSITFVVDENLPSLQRRIEKRSGEELEMSIVYDSKTSNKATPTLASSFHNDTFCYMGTSAFFDAMVKAYADHRPVILSPDMDMAADKPGLLSLCQ